MPPSLKLTEEIAADIKARVKTLDFKAIEKARKGKDDNGTFDVIISTEDTDRSGEIVKQNGWELQNYKNNPIVLWGHDYYSLPIGVCTETYLTEKNGVPALGARGVFLSADINPFAQQVRKLYEFGIAKGEGVGCTTSVGFIPKEFDEEARNTITKAELLEFSFVPIPANQGVGPAQGRALTFAEARELKLDTRALIKKGLEIVEDKKEEEKEAQAGDACETDDGSPGVLTSDPKDPNGPLVCLPQDEDKSAKAESAKTGLLANMDDEHDRHAEEVSKCFDSFQKAVASREPAEENETDEKRAKRLTNEARQMRDDLKDLGSALADEHGMHRAKSVAAFRSFNPTDKAFDKNDHLDALRGEHDAYDTKCNKAFDSFAEKCMKAVQSGNSTDEHSDWMAGKMEGAQNVHRKAVAKITKAMCKEAYGEEDPADEKTLEILKEFLAPHIDAQLLPVITGKIGSKLATESNNKLGEAHQHLKAAIAIVERLGKGLGNDEGEEGRSADDMSESAPTKQRSRPTEGVRQKDELEAHLLAKDILRGVTTAAQEGLTKLKQRAKQ
jgi:hypothetical protein